MQSIVDFCPQGAEAGVGLALQDDEGRDLSQLHTIPRSRTVLKFSSSQV